MTLRRIFGRFGAYLVGALIVLMGAGEVPSQASGFDHAACRQLALERNRLENEGVKQHLALKPSDVLARFGRSGVTRVETYIKLSEQVLFKCPPNILNATAAPIEHREQFLPPTPMKGPKRVRRPVRAPIVPLPVKAPFAAKKPGASQRPGIFPASQG